MMSRGCLIFLFLLVPSVTAAAPRPIPVKVVVVAMFESGADTGDEPGELQYWVERDRLDHVYRHAGRLSRGAHERSRGNGGADGAGNGSRGGDDHGGGVGSRVSISAMHTG